MKKLLTFAMIVGFVITSANLTAAESINLRAGISVGNAGLQQSNLRLSAATKGFYVSANVQAEKLPIQITGSYYLLNPNEVPVSAMAGYKLNAGGSAGHILIGYGNSTLAGGLGWTMHSFNVVDVESGQEITFTANGPALGVFASLPLTRQLYLGGELHYAPSAKVNANSAGASYEASQGNILGYEVRGTFQPRPQLMLEAGYRQSMLNGAEGYTMSGDGIFAGAGIRF